MPQAISFTQHDHADCTGDVLKRAEKIALSKGLRLTEVRRRVLEILAEEHRALGAYEILDRLNAEGYGSQPPVAYRALDFLVTHGLAHRIRRLNAFAACTRPAENHAPVFLICASCQKVAELSGTAAANSLRQEAIALGFSIERMSLEAAGTCPGCEKDNS